AAAAPAPRRARRGRGRPPPPKGIVASMLLFNFGILFVFKYLMFAVRNINHLTGTNLTIPSIVLPIGISFFTFQAVSYVLDVYRGDVKAQRNPVKVALYIALFPQLVAGPIVRYTDIVEQIDSREETFDLFSEGVVRFICGFAKKMLLANPLAIVADTAFSPQSDGMSVLFAWLGALAYTFQIYYDFSGYSDMAIGLGKMFGFNFRENFNHPYIAGSVSDFWRRWHVSLSSWFRDYVYFPLGGSRVKSKARLVFNLFVVWALTGVWHGANWTFIAWGIFYFVLLTFEKLTGLGDDEKKRGSAIMATGNINETGRVERPGFPMPFLARGLRHSYVILAVVCGWVIFRASDLAQASHYLSTMFGLGDVPWISPLAITYFKETVYYWIFALLFSMPVMRWASKFPIMRPVLFLRPMALVIILVIGICYMVKSVHNPFIYFNF
ncbi:MAG: hypothetical protein LBG65_00490, partial [Puniceicoccales bacterium]|nr:hypothetical protein [Puniceicoccales bacterium]